MDEQKKRHTLYLDRRETPLLIEWTERNPGLWPKVVKALIEDLLKSGGLPMDLLGAQLDSAKSASTTGVSREPVSVAQEGGGSPATPASHRVAPQQAEQLAPQALQAPSPTPAAQIETATTDAATAAVRPESHDGDNDYLAQTPPEPAGATTGRQEKEVVDTGAAPAAAPAAPTVPGQPDLNAARDAALRALQQNSF